MRIHKLEIENIKKISAVEITPDGTLVVVSGLNEQGKSSIIDSICYGLGGAEALKHTPRPLKEGSDEGRIVIELDDYIVTRWWTSNETTYLKVTTKDLATYPAPQALLEKLVGDLTFDPLEFMRMKESEQIDMLMNFIGKKDELTKLNIKYADIYNERTLINKEFKKLQVYFNEIPVPADNLPDEEIDLDELNEKYAEATKALEGIKYLGDRYKELGKQIAYNVDRITEYQKQIEKLNDSINDAKASMEECVNQGNELRKISSPDGIKAKIIEAQAMNNKIRSRDLKYRTENEMGDKKVEADNLTTKLEAITEEKKKLIVDSKFPVQGLSFDDGMVLFNNIPFTQAADSIKLKVSFAIGMWMNPKLKVMMSKHGNDIDDKNMKLLYEMAKDNGFQLWIEKIREDQFPAIIIEDGTIKELSFPSVTNSSKKKGKKNGDSNSNS